MATLLPVVFVVVALSSAHLLPSATASRFPVCAASGAAPVVLGEALSFCGTRGVSCCDAAADAGLREQFRALNISNDAACTTIVKAIICAKCAASLSTTEPANLYAAADPTTVARSIPLLCASSSRPVPPTSSTRRSSATTSPADQQDDGLCLERIRTGSYLGMAPHPDGSSRVFLWTQDGKVSVASVPKRGSRRAMRVDNIPILDLTARAAALMGVAFHREFATNGRFFVSYACDSASPACAATTSAAAAGNGSRSTQSYLLVVDEFSVNSGGHNYSKVARADPSEPRRIFTMELPLQHTSSSWYQPYGGQILFPPMGGDRYLYLIAGHGGAGDHSRDKGSSFYGKIIRFDVDGATLKPEIFAVGLDNPRGCSFDSERPSDLYCAGVDEQWNEQVYLISDQYGNDYRGSSAMAIPLVINHGRPAPGRAPSIVGGRTYDGSTEPSLKGRYLYMYGSTVWAAVENVENGMLHSARIAGIKCSRSTPIACRSGRMGGSVISLGEDNSKDVFFLSAAGIHRVVEGGFCTIPPHQPRQPTDVFGWLLDNKVAGDQQQTTPGLDNNNGLGRAGATTAAALLALFLLYVAHKKLFPAWCTGQQQGAAHHECNSCWGSNNFWPNITYNNNYFSNDGVGPRHAGSVEMGRYE